MNYAIVEWILQMKRKPKHATKSRSSAAKKSKTGAPARVFWIPAGVAQCLSIDSRPQT